MQLGLHLEAGPGAADGVNFVMELARENGDKGNRERLRVYVSKRMRERDLEV